MNPEKEARSKIQHQVDDTLINRQEDANEENSFFSGSRVQPKLKIGNPDDPYEKEADQTADQVVQKMEDESEFPSVQRKYEKPEEEKIQTKGGESGQTVPASIESRLNANQGEGKPLPGQMQISMENAFGEDLSDVRVHTDSNAEQLNAGLSAKAFTYGKDIYFNSGEYDTQSSEGKHLLAHEITHVLQQRGKESTSSGEESYQKTTPQISRALSGGQITSAIDFNTARFDEASIRIIQIITGTTVDGQFGQASAQAVAAFQVANGLTEDGKVGQNTLNTMVLNRSSPGVGLHEQAIKLVIDFFDLNVTTDTLSVHFDPSLAGMGATSFETGNLRVIRVGPLAFLAASILRDTIIAELAVAPPAAAAIGPRPTHLSSTRERKAVDFNKRRFTDPRSVRAIQGLVGANPDGTFGRDTVERIAEYQSSNGGLTIDGKVGERTLRVMVADLEARGHQNAVIRLIIDFFDMSEFDALLDIRFDPSLTGSNAATGGSLPGPSLIRIGVPGFTQGFEGLVHTIAHELEHVKQRRDGIMNQDLREFLAEAIEILSVGMPEEDLAGFFDDARRALRRFDRLSDPEKKTHFARFEEVRAKVQQRFNAASALEQAVHQTTMDDYNAVVEPP